MTDGQEFYTLIVFFYIFSCIKLVPPGGVAVYKRFFRGWTLREPMMSLGGVKKSLFFAPLLPWPSAVVISEYSDISGDTDSDLSADGRGNAPQIGSPASRVRLIRLAYRASVDLRLISLYILILFLGVVPYCYSHEGGSIRTITAIGLSFLAMFLAGLRFFFLHRRFAPNQRVDRYKHGVFSLIMPWHAMRLSDEFLHLPRFSHIHPVILASMDDGPRGNSYLAKSARESVYSKNPAFLEPEVKSLFESLGIEWDVFFTTPEKTDPEATYYCPCCQSEYTSPASQCGDCDGVNLVSWD